LLASQLAAFRGKFSLFKPYKKLLLKDECDDTTYFIYRTGSLLCHLPGREACCASLTEKHGAVSLAMVYNCSTSIRQRGLIIYGILQRRNYCHD
jgi:hypothetical protein